MIKKMFILLVALWASLGADPLTLKNLIVKAQVGDYVAFSRNKNYTLLVVRGASPQEIVMEELSIPEALFPRQCPSWRYWLENGAPGHTARVLYKVDLQTGKLKDYYSYTHNSTLDVNETENLFTKLLNLSFTLVPLKERRAVGTSDGRTRPWNPKMVVDAREIPGVWFDAWQARWPDDGSELGGKLVQVYIPQPNSLYPGYFPYWIKIQATVGKAHLRVVDSGKGLSGKTL